MKHTTNKNTKPSRRRGVYLPIILVLSSLFLAYAVLVITIAFYSVKKSIIQNKRITAMSVAEAGINYYMWHLTQNEGDYCDNKLPCDGYGPFASDPHDYYDQSNPPKKIGTFTLYITPPSANQTAVTVKSVGKVNGSPITRTIETKLGMPSFTNYALLSSNTQAYLARSETINGSVFMNNTGLKLDGIINGDITTTFSDDPTDTSNYSYNSWFGAGKPGIWGLAPEGTGRVNGTIKYNAPSIDMQRILVDISRLREKAQAEDQRGGDYYGASTTEYPSISGWHIKLSSSSYDIYIVQDWNSNGTSYDINPTNSTLANKKEVLYAQNIPYPTSGLIFIDNNVWVEGKIDNQKISIVQGLSDKNMFIPGKIEYTNKTGSDKIGLISASVCLNSFIELNTKCNSGIVITRGALNNPGIDDMVINANMLAPYGYIQLPEYASGQKRHSISVYGSIAHKLPGGTRWAYYNPISGDVLTGYENTSLDQDPNSVLDPPPFFPNTSGYQILQWREE